MRKIFSLLIVSVFFNCSNGFFQNLFHQNKTSFPLPVILSGAPKVTLPKSIPEGSLRVEEDSNIPRLIGRSQVPVGKIYNLTLDLKKKDGTGSFAYKSLTFSKPVQLEFPVDLTELEAKGFTKEFYVWYKDFATKEWKVLQKGVLDLNNSSVKVETNHFTPFILTSLPSLPNSGVATAASCFTTESASWNLQGVLDDSSVSQAKFGIIGEGYQYYQDRPYFVKENEGAFRELGLELSLLLPTCQGGAGTCGNSLLHSDSAAPEYLAFNAVQNIDVYVMYDTRGGLSPSDTSQDADWLSGFTLLTGKYIYTTEPGLDPAQTAGASGYKVYKRTYAQGSRVSLGGNKKGTLAPGISSNYWVVVKPAGTQGSIQSSAMLCASGPDPKIPDPVKGNIFPGSDKVLLWLLYETGVNSPDKLVIRRSEISPPMTPAMGEEPIGIEVTPYSFIDTGLIEGHTYYYSIFALNADGMYNGITVGTASTGPDMDGDGLSDTTEFLFRPGIFSQEFGLGNPYYMVSNPDSDSDGIDDFTELAHGVAPFFADNTPPTASVTSRSENASSGVVDLQIALNDNTLNLYSYCYIRRFSPGMTEEEFLRKPFSISSYTTPDPTMDQTLNRWHLNCQNSTSYIFTYELGKSGPGKPDRFAIWARDAAGNVSDPVIKEFQGYELKVENEFLINFITPPEWNVPNPSQGFLIGSFPVLYDIGYSYPITHNFGISSYFANNEDKQYTHFIPTKGVRASDRYDSNVRSPNLIGLSNNSATYYEAKTTVGPGPAFQKKNSVSIDYQFSRTRPQAKHFPVQIGSNSGYAAFYSGASNLQSSVFNIQNGSISVNSYSLSGIPSGFFPSFILESDFGQGFGLLNGSFFQDYLLDSWNTPFYKTFGEGMNHSDFSGTISIDRLDRYNPQDEAETYAILRQGNSADLRILYRKSGATNFTSIPVTTGIPGGYFGRQVQFVSYKDFSGNSIYHLYVLIRKATGTSIPGVSVLLRYNISSSGGIPSYQFDRQIDFTSPVNVDRFYMDSSGRFLVTIGIESSYMNVYLNWDGIMEPLFYYRPYTGAYDSQFAFVPRETVQLNNIGGYSKLRVLPTGAYSDYRIYGFLPANSDLIFRHHVYDSKGNECETPTTAGTANVLATGTGNYGVPPAALAVVSDNTVIQNAQKVKAPSSAATLVLESSYTQGASNCRTGQVARDTVTIPVRKKIVQPTTSYYHDFSLNPANVPAQYNTQAEPSGYNTADFKKWENLSKSSPQRLGTYVRKNIVFWWPYAFIDEANPCIITDVTMEDGRAICHNAFGGYPAFVEDYVNQYDRYTFTGQYVYSGDKLVPAP